MNRKVPYLLVAAIIVYILAVSVPNVYVIGLINIGSLIVLSWGVFKITGRIFTPFILIAGCLYLFHSGILWISVFSYSPSTVLTSFSERFQTNDYNYILHIYNEVTILLVLFMASGILFSKKLTNDPKSINIACKPTKFFRVAFLILYIVGFFIEIKRGIAVHSSSYAEGFLYGSSIESHIATSVNVLLLFFLFVYRKDKKQFNYFMALQLIRVFFIMFFVGNRGVSVINLLITLFIVVIYSYLASDINKIKQLVIATVVGMLFLLPLASAIRGSSDEVALDSLRETGFLVKFFGEFGGSVENVFLCKDFTESVGITYGFQILCNTLALIPGSSAIFGDVITNNTSLGAILNEYFGRAALGGSLLGQLYFNFNGTFLLYLSIVLVGAFASWCSNKLFEKRSSIYYYVFFLCLFSGIMTWVRGEFYDVVIQVKMCCYILILIFISRDLLLKKVYTNYF